MTEDEKIPVIPHAFRHLKEGETLTTRDCVSFYKDNTVTIKNLKTLKDKGYIENLNDREGKKGKNKRNRFILTEKGREQLTQQLKKRIEQEKEQETAELNYIIEELEKATRPFSLFDKFIDNSEDNPFNIYRAKLQEIYAKHNRFQTVYQDSEDQSLIERFTIAPCREKIKNKLEELKPKFEEKFRELQPDIEELKNLLFEYRFAIATFQGKLQQADTGMGLYSNMDAAREYATDERVER